ncbi:MAG: hypothetical protein M3Y35_18180 [Actinomycetota bacterium]|nr:hypothetical protein [Actinomycetota bacterium]
MSKVNAMQAIREARYAARSNRPSVPAARTAPTAHSAALTSAEAVAAGPIQAPDTAGPLPLAQAGSEGGATDEVAATEEEALCGHRSMNNRNCRRPAGHPEKNHRYN